MTDAFGSITSGLMPYCMFSCGKHASASCGPQQHSSVALQHQREKLFHCLEQVCSLDLQSHLGFKGM